MALRAVSSYRSITISLGNRVNPTTNLRSTVENRFNFHSFSKMRQTPLNQSLWKNNLPSTNTSFFEALSPKGERFLIHSSQLKGSSNRLLPVLPTASPSDSFTLTCNGISSKSAIHPSPEELGFLAPVDKVTKPSSYLHRTPIYQVQSIKCRMSRFLVSIYVACRVKRFSCETV